MYNDKFYSTLTMQSLIHKMFLNNDIFEFSRRKALNISFNFEKVSMFRLVTTIDMAKK